MELSRGEINEAERFQEIENRLQRIEDKLDSVLDRLGRNINPQASHNYQDTIAQKQDAQIKKHGIYSYRPLDFSKNEFRILGIDNSEVEDAPISCSLIHSTLDIDRSDPSWYITNNKTDR